jgi:hypothetical protein
MTNPALTWISEAYQGGYLRAAFIDCQILEYYKLTDKKPFVRAATLASGLREHNISISHFMYDETERGLLTPFQYRYKNKTNIPYAQMDFEGVIPEPDEWVYPKETYNGFENDNAETILYTGDALERSVLIGAGFTARGCLQETITGSFERAVNPDKHHVIVTLDATNLHPDYYHEYKTDFLAQADESIRGRIGFAVVDEITAALIKRLPHPTPSQSSQARPYTV